MKIYIFMLSVLLTSCIESAGWVDLLDTDQHLIVSAMWEAHCDENQPIVVRLTGLTQTQAVDEATFRLTVNDTQIDSIHTYSYDSGYYVTEAPGWSNYYLNYDFHPGDKVSIEVQSKGRTAKAETQVPYPIEIVSVDTLHLEKNSKSLGARSFVRFFIRLRQPEEMKGEQFFRFTLDNATSCYEAQCGQYPWSAEYNTIVENVMSWTEHTHDYDYDADIAIKGSERNNKNEDDYFDFGDYPTNIYGTFRNSVFKHGEYTLCIDVEDLSDYRKSTDNFSPLTGSGPAGYYRTLTFSVHSISRMEYLYLNALSALDCYDGAQLISMPPVVPSNVQGGTGIFTISSAAEVTFSYGPGQVFFEGDDVTK